MSLLQRVAIAHLEMLLLKKLVSKHMQSMGMHETSCITNCVEFL